MKSIAEPNGAARDLMLRTMASDLAANMKERIHVDGKNSSDAPIGQYSNKYLNIRDKFKRGRSKKVILSLTRQMENDFSIISGSGATGYALGFKNSLNFDKSQWNEDRYGDVYKPTVKEQNQLRKVAEQFIADLLNK